MESIEKQNELLKKENESLKIKIENIKSKKIESRESKKRLLKKGVYVWAGSDLKTSVSQLFNELPNKVKRDTLANVFTSVFKRLVRVTLVGIMLACIPGIILLIQTIILNRQTDILNSQNRKLDIQNNKIQSQIQLDEAARRSNYVLLMDNVLSQINNETDKNKFENLTLSNTLISRVIALSHGLRPYKSFDFKTDSLSTKTYSLERSQLLLALANSEINPKSLIKIYRKSNFSNSFLEDIDIDSSFIEDVNLQKSKFFNVGIIESSFYKSDFSKAQLDSTYIVSSDLDLTTFILADFENGGFYDGRLNYSRFKEAKLKTLEFSNLKMSNTKFNLANISNTKFEKATLRFSEFSSAILQDVKFIDSDLSFSDFTKTILGNVSFDENTVLDYVKVHREDWLSYVKDSLKLEGADRLMRDYKVVSLKYERVFQKPNNNRRLENLKSIELKNLYVDIPSLSVSADESKVFYTLIPVGVTKDSIYYYSEKVLNIQIE